MRKSTAKEQSRAEAANESTNEIAKVAVSTIVVSAGIIGVWAVACMIAGISSSGSPIAFLGDLFKAITG